MYRTIPIPKPIEGLVMEVAIPVPHPTIKSDPFMAIKSLGNRTLLITALIITALRAAFGVGDMTDM